MNNLAFSSFVRFVIFGKKICGLYFFFIKGGYWLGLFLHWSCSASWFWFTVAKFLLRVFYIYLLQIQHIRACASSHTFLLTGCFCSRHVYLDLIVGYVLWHINPCRLLNAKFCIWSVNEQFVTFLNESKFTCLRTIK